MDGTLASPATKPPAKSDGAGALMTAAEMKPLLHLAKRQPVNCAIAMDKDKQGIILLHRKTRPKKLLAELKVQAKAKGLVLDLASVRFGHVSVDGASDSGMATFTVNKPAPGPMKRALLEQVRPAGLQRCEIVLDEGLESETDDEDYAGGGTAQGGPTPRAADAGQGTVPPHREQEQARGSAAPAAPAGAPPGVMPAPGPSSPAGPGVAASMAGAAGRGTAGPAATSTSDPIRARLAGLGLRARAALASGSPQAGGIAAAAAQARGALASGDMARAGQAADAMERLLGAGPSGPGAGAGGGRDDPAAAAGTPGRGGGMVGSGAAMGRQPDRAAAMRDDLRGLAARIASAAPADRRGLVRLGNAARDALASGDLAGAEAGIEALRRALPAGGRVDTGGQRPEAELDQPGSAAAAVRAGVDARATTPRDRAADVRVADNAPGGTATDAGGPGTGPAPAPTPPPSGDDSWRSADGWDHRPVPPGTPPVVTDVPRALGEFDDAHGRVLTRAAGAAQAAGAAGEGLVAGGLMLAPEPTLLTKAAGVAMGVNAADNFQAGLRTAWTGQPRQTLAAQAAGAGAQALGASPEQAARVAGYTDLGQGLAGFGATAAAGVLRSGAGVAERGAGALERGAPSALTGDVLPPSQPLALGGTQVRQALVQPTWPQTVTAGPGRVDINELPARPREPPQLAPPLEPPPPSPPPTAEQQVQALPGHGDARHGTRTTPAQQEARVRTGLAPDGDTAPAPVATRFDSPEAQIHAVTEARRLIDAMVANGSASTAMRGRAGGRAEIPRKAVVVTGYPGGYGSGVQVRRNPVTNQPLPGRPVDPTGQYPNAMVVFKWNPLRGRFEPLTQYPTNEPLTPP